jgi:hypothetical protein
MARLLLAKLCDASSAVTIARGYWHGVIIEGALSACSATLKVQDKHFEGKGKLSVCRHCVADQV